MDKMSVKNRSAFIKCLPVNAMRKQRALIKGKNGVKEIRGAHVSIRTMGQL